MNRLWSWLCKKRKFPNPFSGIRLPRVKLRLTPRLVIIGVAFALVGLHTTANLLAWKVLQREIRKIQSSSDDQYLLIVDLSMSSFGQPMDAAPFYNAAYEFLRQSPDELTEVRRLAEEWSEPGPPPPEALEVVRPYLQSQPVTRAVEFIEEAGPMSVCIWVIYYSGGYWTVLPHLARVRCMTDVMLLRARLSYVDGDDEGALSDVQSAVDLADSLSSDRCLVSRLVQCSLLRKCVTACRLMVETTPMAAETAMALGKSLAEAEGTLGLADALRMQSAMLYDFSEQMVADTPRWYDVQESFEKQSEHWGLSLLLSYPFRPLYRLQQAELLRCSRRIVELKEKSYYEARDELTALRADLHARREPNLVSLLWVPVLDQLSWTDEARATLRAARLGLALEARRHRTGSYPGSLGELVPALLPELPVDPFSGESLLYRLSEEEVLVYSVGKNGTDDGGLTEKEEDGEKVNPGTDDVAWRVPRWDVVSE